MRVLYRFALLTGFLAVTVEHVAAQLNFGSIQGRVVDTSGAAVPGATVKDIFLTKNLQRQTVSDPMGRFVVPSLEPGPYSVTVELSGFKTQRRDGLVLLTGQTLDIEVQMEVGNLTDRGYRRVTLTYPGPRNSGLAPTLSEREIYFGRNYFIRVRKTFGG